MQSVPPVSGAYPPPPPATLSSTASSTNSHHHSNVSSPTAAPPPSPPSSPPSVDPGAIISTRKKQDNALLDGVTALCFDVREFGISQEEWLYLSEGDMVNTEARDSSRARLHTTPSSFSSQGNAFSPSQFVQTKLRYGASLETVYQDLDSFASLLKDEIHQHLNTQMKPDMTVVAQRGAALRREIETIRPTLHQVVQQLQDLCDKLRLTVGQAHQKIQAGKDAAVQQSFEMAYLKAMLLYDQMAATTMHHSTEQALDDESADQRTTDFFPSSDIDNNHHPHHDTNDGLNEMVEHRSSQGGSTAVAAASAHHYEREQQQRKALYTVAAALLLDDDETDDTTTWMEEQDNGENGEQSAPLPQQQQPQSAAPASSSTKSTETASKVSPVSPTSAALLRSTRERMDSMPLLVSGVLELRRLRELLRHVVKVGASTKAFAAMAESSQNEAGCSPSSTRDGKTTDSNTDSSTQRLKEWKEVCLWCDQAEQFVLQQLEQTFLYWCENYFESCGLTTTSGHSSSGADSDNGSPRGSTVAGGRGLSAAEPAQQTLLLKSSPSAMMLQEVPRWFYLLGATQRFTEVCQQKVLIPLMQRVVSWTAAAQTRHNVEAMLELLKRLQHVVQQHVAPLLPLWCSPAEAKTRSSDDVKLLCPVADIVWPAVCTVLQEKLVSLFDAGIPEAFRRKYLAASALEQAVADLCATPEEVNQLRRSAVSRVWRSKWNVDIYAAECVMTSTRELNLLTESWKRAMMLVIGIGAPVNTAAARKRESPGRPGEGSSSVAASASPSDSGQSGELTAAHRISAFNALQSLWVALRRDVLERFFTEMYLPPATLALLRHCLLSSKSVAGRVTQVLADVFRSLSTFTASGEAYTAMEVAVLTLALSGMEDICLLGEYITSSGLQRIEQTTATATIASPALSATLQQACRFTSERLRQEEYTAIRSMVYEHVERHITPPLQHIKSVRSFFSHTQRSMPDAPSWYVETILTPIRALARAFQAYQQQQQETSTSLSLSTSSTSSASPSTRVKPMSKVTVWGVCQQMSTTTTTTNTNFKSGDASDPSYGLVSMSTPSLQMMRVAQASFTADYCALVLRIATTVFTRFTELARETLGAAKKAEEGWEKLRRKREAAAAAAAAAAGGAGGPAGEMNQATAAAGASRRRVTAENATDIDKMILQLYLDANELLQQLRALLPSGAVDSLEKEQIVVDLHTLLRRGQWISGAAIEEPPELDF